MKNKESFIDISDKKECDNECSDSLEDNLSYKEKIAKILKLLQEKAEQQSGKINYNEIKKEHNQIWDSDNDYLLNKQ